MRAAEILRYMESSFIKKLISAIVKATKAKNNERSVWLSVSTISVNYVESKPQSYVARLKDSKFMR